MTEYEDLCNDCGRKRYKIKRELSEITVSCGAKYILVDESGV